MTGPAISTWARARWMTEADAAESLGYLTLAAFRADRAALAERGFPDPMPRRGAAGRVWRREDVEAWASAELLLAVEAEAADPLRAPVAGGLLALARRPLPVDGATRALLEAAVGRLATDPAARAAGAAALQREARTR